MYNRRPSIAGKFDKALQSLKVQGLSCKLLKKSHPSPGILSMFWMLLTLIGTLCRADLSSNEIVCLLKGADPIDHRIALVSHRNVIESTHDANPGIAQPKEEEKTSQLPAPSPRHPPYKPIGEPVLYKGCRLHMKKFSFFIRDSMHAAASFWYIICVVCGGWGG